MMVREGYKEVRIGPKTKLIPVNWEVKRLKYIADINMGSSPPSKTYNEEEIGLPFFQGNAEFQFIHPVVKQWCSKPQKVAKENDILISVRAPVGDLNIADCKCCIGRGLAAIRGVTSDTKFLYYLLSQNKKSFVMYSQGSTFSSINKNTLELLQFSIPPLPEQKKIASILSSVDKAIEKTDEIIEETKELKKGLMQQLLTKGIGHSEFKEARVGVKKYRIPNKWNIEMLNNLITLKNGKFNPTKNLDDNYLIPVYGGNGITGYFDSFLIDKPTIIIGRVGEYCGSIYFTKEKCWVTDNAIYVEGIKNTNEIDIEYLALYLKFNNLNKLSNRTGQPKLTQSRISSVYIPLPPLQEQKKIAAILSSVDDKIQKEQEYKDELIQLKKGLMQKLLTGEVRVKIDEEVMA